MAGGGTHPEECMLPNLRCFGRQASAKSEVGSARPKVGPEHGCTAVGNAHARTPLGPAQKRGIAHRIKNPSRVVLEPPTHPLKHIRILLSGVHMALRS
eukprot:scaffold7141_cov107-Isochrysis_galbana.AAC.9